MWDWSCVIPLIQLVFLLCVVRILYRLNRSYWVLPPASAGLPASGGMECRRNQRALILSALKACSVNPCLIFLLTKVAFGNTLFYINNIFLSPALAGWNAGGIKELWFFRPQKTPCHPCNPCLIFFCQECRRLPAFSYLHVKLYTHLWRARTFSRNSLA